MTTCRTSPRCIVSEVTREARSQSRLQLARMSTPSRPCIHPKETTQFLETNPSKYLFFVHLCFVRTVRTYVRSLCLAVGHRATQGCFRLAQHDLSSLPVPKDWTPVGTLVARLRPLRRRLHRWLALGSALGLPGRRPAPERQLGRHPLPPTHCRSPPWASTRNIHNLPYQRFMRHAHQLPLQRLQIDRFREPVGSAAGTAR